MLLSYHDILYLRQNYTGIISVSISAIPHAVKIRGREIDMQQGNDTLPRIRKNNSEGETISTTLYLRNDLDSRDGSAL